MRLHSSCVFLLAACLSCWAADKTTGTNAASLPPGARPMAGVGNAHHPVSTKNAQAQMFFDQGLRLIYAFNHEEAAHAFEEAAKLDPQLAMAYWGIAEAVGPNYNDPASDERFMEAHKQVQKAVELSAKATASEQAYIAALAIRFPADTKANRKQAAEQYRDAMRKVSQDYPEDLDAATLFAESAMNLRPWELWNHDATPAEGTEEIVATLESVLKRDPNHVGAIHYYIHAVEASSTPERALAAANRLAALAPEAGHLVHMPAHVYIRTGDYQAGVTTNQKAAAADEAYMKSGGGTAMYPVLYYSHNLHFIAACASMNGNYAEASAAAARLMAHVGPHVKELPPLDAFAIIPMAVDVRFHKWATILASPQPPAERKNSNGYWHFARGMALAATGKVREAEAEYKQVMAMRDTISPDEIFAMPVPNKTRNIFTIAVDVLGAKIALAKKDNTGAIDQLRAAVEVQDSLRYSEPPDWFFPVREMLGGVLLAGGDATGAEKVFREDLQRNPRNPRSLFGLSQALKTQGHEHDAWFVQQEFQASWKGGNSALTVADLT